MAPAIYKPLNQQANEIRVVTVAGTSDPSERIRCELSTYAFECAPRYVALSYCWGDEGDTMEIFVNGQAMMVTRSLFTALKHFRQIKDFKMWIDAICINQNDPIEKSYQVFIMEDIYRNSMETAAWLGEEQADTSLAFELLKQLNIAGRRLANHTRSLASYQDIRPVADCLSPYLDKKYRDALQNFTHLPYWGRLWVVQETILSPRMYFNCGGLWITLSDLHVALGMLCALSSPSNVKYLKQPIPELVGLYFNGWHPIPLLGRNKEEQLWDFFDFPTLLSYTSRLQCKDERDRLFALIGLSKLAPPEKWIYIPPDYTKSVYQTYSDFWMQLLHETKDLTILETAGIANRRYGGHIQLPSWMPDVGHMRSVNRDQIQKSFKACGSAEPSFSIAIHHGLETLGVYCDSIAKVISPVRCEDGKIETGRTLDALFETLDTSEWTHRQHPSGQPWPQVIFRTLFLDGKDIGTCRPEFRMKWGAHATFDLAASFCSGLSVVNDTVDSDLSVTRPVRDYALAVGHWARQSKFPALSSSTQTQNELLEPFCGPAYSSRHLDWLNDDENGKGRQLWPACYFRLNEYLRDTDFCITTNGYVGLGPADSLRERDKICVIPGCHVPLVIRQVEDHYVLIGDCYVYGMMNGEMVYEAEQGTLNLERIILK